MASTQLSAPGTDWGPCATACDHVDCAASRKMAATPCSICGKSIGYDTQYFADPVTHASCAIRAFEDYFKNVD